MIKTLFKLGDKVWTIHNCKAIEIEIESMTIDKRGVWIRGKEEYNLFHEDNCFSSRDQLIRHITTS